MYEQIVMKFTLLFTVMRKEINFVCLDIHFRTNYSIEHCEFFVVSFLMAS